MKHSQDSRRINLLDRKGQKWNREETIIAYSLFCQIPFGQISKTNSDIIELADLVGRTPSSVALKMFNLAHHDPGTIERNVVAMSHTSKLDKTITEEFFGDWEDLSFQAEIILERYRKKQSVSRYQLSENTEDFLYDFPEGKDTEQTVRARINQQFFRNSVLSSYNNRCCITGLKIPELLIASHIKPWKVADSKTERTNPANGLCLNALHDKAFDRGFITLDKQLRVYISSKLDSNVTGSEVIELITRFKGQEIELPARFTPNMEFIEYHNDVVFQG